jgi:DNA polymerase I-like protein with 3'-5' exonuclease and polymerase domains
LEGNSGSDNEIEEVEVFDIVNAGPRHRFTVSSVLVSNTNFGIQNGTTGKGLHAQLVSDYWSAAMTPPEWLTGDWCDKFIVRWHAAYPEVQPYFDTQYYRARRYKFVWNPWGRVRYIPQVMSSLPWKVSEGLREAQNFPVTSSNAEQTKLAMVECEGSFERCREGAMHCEGLLSIHDQVIAEVDEEYAEAVGTEIVSIFESVMNDRSTGERLWRVPIRADCEILERWKAKE